MGNKITRRRPVIDDRHTRPQGLYPSRDVDQRKLRRLILDSKLAPCYPGSEEPAVDLEECPICFLHYPSLNRSKCCTKGICTECFLQVKSPNVTRPTQCPYCKMANYSVEYRGPKSMEEKGVEQAEEQKVIEAKIRMRQQELHEDEEREHRRNDDNNSSRDTCCVPIPSLADSLTRDSEQQNWRAAWESVSHTPSQGALSSSGGGGASERPVLAMELDSLWVQGARQCDENDNSSQAPAQHMTVLALAPQQQGLASAPPRNHGFPTPQAPPGAQLTSGAPPPPPPTSGFSRHNRDDEFDLDLEDIMVMEAIWLSIQEQGARHRYMDDEPRISTPPSGSFPTLMTNFSLCSDGDTDLGEIILPPPPPPPLLLPVPSPPSALNIQEQAAPGRRNLVTGGLAGAIAALAERQVAGGSNMAATTARQSILGILPAPDPTTGSRRKKEVGNSGTNNLQCAIPYGEDEEEARETSDNPSALLQRKKRNDGSSPVEDSADFRKPERVEGAHGSSARIRDSENLDTSKGWANWVSSEQAEVGTSFSGSSIPSASELPWEAPEIPPDGGRRNGEGSWSSSSSGSGEEAGRKRSNNGGAVVPESFEEQMMLAMALSLAEAQANMRVHHRDSGGSLARQSSNVQ